MTINEELMEQAVAFRIKWDMTLYEALDVLIKYDSNREINKLRGDVCQCIYDLGTVIFDKHV